MEHRDRLARLGVEHLETAIAASGRRLVVVDPEDETASGLVGEITGVLTLMCARVYGQRAAKSRAARAVAVAAGKATE